MKNRSPNKILGGLLILSLLWAVGVSALYWHLKHNPTLLPVHTEMGSADFPWQSSMERLSFLRQFVEQYYSYNSENFWQSQTSLALLMDSPLREERLTEVRRLQQKIQRRNLSQSVHIKDISLSPEGAYILALRLQLFEEDQAPQNLPLQVALQLQNSERSLDNPWGLQVNSLQVAHQDFQFTAQIHLKPQNPAVLSFPCAVEQVTPSTHKNLKIKITTLKTSEVQMILNSPLTAELGLRAFCKDQQFEFTIKNAEGAQSLLAVIPATGFGQKRRPNPLRIKDRYDKTIENVLGIKVE